MAHKSITQRIRTARNAGHRKREALDWISAWERETLGTLDDMYKAFEADDIDQLHILTGKLKSVLKNRFKTVPNVVSLLCDYSQKR